MSARIGVFVIAAALALYIVLVGQRAVLLLMSGDPVGVLMGVALVVLPLIAAWGLARELWFGVRAEQLARRLEGEDALPTEEVGVRPSGRVLREDGDAVFPAYRREVEENPEDWRAWYRLGLAYDAAGDRRRAREAVRRAIRLESVERRAAAGG
ncbi:tetratricopeptide repeat protein [Microbacterium sp.]|jgi:cytochrome c-type biogenesis protein CcmH/NrfG|uniref:tetratricopeptide repeat protein n=1 Tax=Microbacterium sp. TaxID=51671 RepID=UPI002BBFFF87|nr:tetratricopeptide repeat protein [Microbacterium sp.]HWL76399.1 tetratricopeptide repeat protein [Microbacterium sp.]